MIIQFTIPGIPQSQGSKTRSKYGMFEDNRKLTPWRADALSFARAARAAESGDGPLFFDAVQVSVVCYFPRTGWHYGTGRNAGTVKPNAPFWVTTNPDLDKCCRALGDVLAISGIVKNDNLIVAWDASKVYGDPRMDVTVLDAGVGFAEFVEDVPAEQDALL